MDDQPINPSTDAPPSSSSLAPPSMPAAPATTPPPPPPSSMPPPSPSGHHPSDYVKPAEDAATPTPVGGPAHQPSAPAHDDPMNGSSSAASAPAGGIKRSSPDEGQRVGGSAGDEDARDAKRVKEDVQEQSPQPQQEPQQEQPQQSATTPVAPPAAPPAQAPIPPAAPVAAPAPGTAEAAAALYMPGTYVPPEKPSLGSRQPMTPATLKAALGAVRLAKKMKEASLFLTPVDHVLLGIPSYPTIITKPMDLGTVESKLLNSPAAENDSKLIKERAKAVVPYSPSMGVYHTAHEVMEDVRQIWKNTRIFNGPDHPVSKTAEPVEDMFEKAFVRAHLDKDPAMPPPPPSASTSAAAAAGGGARSPSKAPMVPPHRRDSAVSGNGPDTASSSRPKRDVHPPPPLDAGYHGHERQRRSLADRQLDYAAKKVNDLLTNDRHLAYAYAFREPVDPVALGIPEYFSVIKNPMDLSTIAKKHADGAYSNAEAINADVELMVNNATTYNRPGEYVHNIALDLHREWKKMWNARPKAGSEEPQGGAAGGSSSSKKKSSGSSRQQHAEDEVDEELADIDSDIHELQDKIATMQSQLEDLQRKRARHLSSSGRGKSSKATAGGGAGGGSKHKSAGGGGGGGGAPKAKRPTNGAHAGGAGGGGGGAKKNKVKYAEQSEDEYEEYYEDLDMAAKQRLADSIGMANEDIVTEAISIIQATTSVQNGDEVEIDIDSLPPRTVWQLYQLVVEGKRGPFNVKKPKKASRPSAGGGAKGSSRRPSGAGGAGGGAKKSSGGGGGAEAERIKQLQQQLGQIDQGAYDDHDGESSEAYSEDEDF